MFLCYGRRRHLDVVLLPEGVDRRLLMVVELLIVRSRREMACRWCGVASTISTAAGLGGMVQQSLDDRLVLMDSRRRVSRSGVVVASTAARPGKVDAAVQL